MLAAIIQNLQNQPQPEAPLPTVHIDRGGGGPSWPRYEIADIIGAIAAFQEIPGEHPVARAVRRHRWIGDALPRIKEAREKRETVAFLTGATLADAAAEERHAAMDQLKIEKIVEIIDAVRAETQTTMTPMTAVSRRGDGMSGGPALGLFISGLALGVMIARQKRSTTTRRA